ncbi:MAG: hypothetical protein LDL39_11615, partial [Magnetospirillum sp.]|nr:hypothetical protein [Magnetospirillum sp.]
ERGKALSKDSRAYNMVHAAIMAKNSGAATAALSKLASHFDETERKNANKTERTGLLAALNASIGRLRAELSKLPRPATAQLSEGQGTNPGDPPHHTNGKTAAAEADALAMWARKIDVEIERLIQLRTLLENSSDRELTRAVTQAVLDNVKNAPPDRALIAALAEYVKDLESNAKDAKRVSGDRLRALTEFVGTTVQGQIATAHQDLMTKRQVEMKNLSLVRNSLGDVSDLVIGSSRLAANSGKTNGGQPDGGKVEQNGQKTPQHLIQSFDTILRVIVALALTVLMVACASQVIFVVCVGALVLLLPLFIHWLLSEQRPSRWSGVLKRVILVALAVLALLVAVPFLYGLGSQVAGWAQGLSAGS